MSKYKLTECEYKRKCFIYHHYFIWQISFVTSCRLACRIDVTYLADRLHNDAVGCLDYIHVPSVVGE